MLATEFSRDLGEKEEGKMMGAIKGVKGWFFQLPGTTSGPLAGLCPNKPYFCSSQQNWISGFDIGENRLLPVSASKLLMATEAVKFAQNDVKCIFREQDWRVECRPFPSSKKSHFQSEARREAIDMETIFHYDANKTHLHNKGFAGSLVLKVRFFGILFRSWYTLLTLHEVDIPVGTSYMIIIMYLNIVIISYYILLLLHYKHLYPYTTPNTPIYPYYTPYTPIQHYMPLYTTIQYHISLYTPI